MSEDKILLEMAKAVENEPERDFFEVMKEIGTDKQARLAEIEKSPWQIRDVGIIVHSDDFIWLITELKAAWAREKIMRDALGIIHERINCTNFPNLNGSSEECKALSDCSHVSEQALAKCSEGKME